MKLFILLLSVSLSIIFIRCKEDEPTVPSLPTTPTVKIVSPKDNSSLFGNVLIEVEANDDKGVVKVEVLIDNQVKSHHIHIHGILKI